MRTYFAIGHKEEDSAFGFWFPDVEGCFGAGDTYDEAMKNAAEALRSHIETLLEMGCEFPEPRSIDEIQKDSKARESLQDYGAFLIGVPLLLTGKVKRRVSFNADITILEAIDRQLALRGGTKTDWWVEAAHEKLSANVLRDAKPPRGSRKGAKAKKQDDGCHAPA